jgi:Tfp pilus assembly protein PilF
MNAEGTRFFQQGNHPAAIRRFEKAIAANPRDADSYYNLAATYHQLARSGMEDSYWATAETYYNQCLDIAPNHEACHRGLAVLLAQQNRQEQAFRLLEGWRDRNPFSPEPKVELARLYEEFGETAESERQLLEAIAADTTNARARAALGKLRESQGDIPQALANYQVALRRNSAQPQLQARVAALTASGLNALPTIPAANGGTRTVTIPPSNIRY